MLWEVDIYAREPHASPLAKSVVQQAADLGLGRGLHVTAARGYLIESSGLDHGTVARVANELLADPIVEQTVVAAVGDAGLTDPPPGKCRLVHVLPKPGVMDPVALSAHAAMADLGAAADAVRTVRKFWLNDIADDQLQLLCTKVLANESIEQVIVGPLTFRQIELGSPYAFERLEVPIGRMDDKGLMRLSREGQLSLQLDEMQAIQAFFHQQGRDATDVELETIAQTWSEHCSHKTLLGQIRYRDENGERFFKSMLKETIFAATTQIRSKLGAADWCVSVFKDNAGIVRFDDQYNLVFKVETHNHPTAIEPYGGANTGIGGVIRDTMGTGLGAKPIANTDVFCFAPPDFPLDQLPPGVIHPRRVIGGVVAGVRDYGNRMGIPTVNGAIYFDPRYLGNPLVYCGNVGRIPRDKSHKQPQPGDLIVVVGGRTGRDGIHGATFSSVELTSHSDQLSGGAVQIGNAITEKMVLDVLLKARDQDLYHAITDCGAGGLSSAVGEMGEEIGAEVWLDRVPLKYEGLTYTEIWISEAQERMVLAVPPDRWDALDALCTSEGVEATVIGKYEPTGRLVLKYADQPVADLSMEFLHDGRPPVVREAHYTPRPARPLDPLKPSKDDATDMLLRILAAPNVASKEWVIRQYDHEVQGGSVIKPLVGANNDGPSDAAVLRPVLSSYRGIVISCGMNPRLGDLDPYHMAASAMDEAVRNCVAVGANPERIAVLDNFCWGDCEQSETLGSLVRAAIACHDVAVHWQTPFISGKDSLNNEFRYEDSEGRRHGMAIPPSLLISALGQMDDVRRAVTMDLKRAGNLLYQVGATKDELGGSHLAMVESLDGGQVPAVDLEMALATFRAVHQAIERQCVRACHDLSEGGLAVAAAEMAFAGGLGADVTLDQVPAALPDAVRSDPAVAATCLLFSESNSRFLCEVTPDAASQFEQLLAGVPHARIGQVTDEPRFCMRGLAPMSPRAADRPLVVDATIEQLKSAWKAPLRFN